ncbi:MAG: sulfite exporter TauE/SafE family protein [Nitrospirota bacterium]|nr:sulfite exporter TauE/SafE family protein [Nitrospirota bacterium]MDH5768436.1 sulfite exporter TauE/SafE family protein [Nitrospirota bacterium]
MNRFNWILALAFALLLIPKNAAAMYMPVSGAEISVWAILALGFGVGVMGGLWGIGGAWLITPGLNIFGFPMAYAIGTDMAHIAGKSIVSTFRHAKFGNVDWAVGLTMVAGTIVGIEISARLVMYLERIGFVGPVVRWTYVVILFIITTTVWYDYFKKMRMEKKGIVEKEAVKSAFTLAPYLHRIPLPPVVNFKHAGIRCSVWVPVIVGLITGIFAGFLGIGGGLLRMPALIYLVGMPTYIAVGTDLFEVLISAGFGAFTYTVKGRCELIAAVIMIIGAGVGVQIGTISTKYIRGYGIRVLFAIATFIAMVSIICKQLGQATIAGTLIMIAIAGLCGFIVFGIFVPGVIKELREKKAGGGKSEQ